MALLYLFNLEKLDIEFYFYYSDTKDENFVMRSSENSNFKISNIQIKVTLKYETRTTKLLEKPYEHVLSRNT